MSLVWPLGPSDGVAVCCGLFESLGVAENCIVSRSAFLDFVLAECGPYGTFRVRVGVVLISSAEACDCRCPPVADLSVSRTSYIAMRIRNEGRNELRGVDIRQGS